jgi:DNA-binding HxlR family transcriptional regulator
MKLSNLCLPPDVCTSVGDVLGRIGNKWSVLIIVMLDEGPLRFTELRKRIGSVSQKMLTLTLRGLERDGYLKRTVTPSIPPRVDYELTTLGRDVMVPLMGLASWALGRRGAVEAARKRYDSRQPKKKASA